MVHSKPAGGYREMLLLDLIELYGPLYPEGRDWQKTAAYLYTEEPDHMNVLTASLETKGWREPIVLSRPEELEDGDYPLVLNGTHRVAIALKEGVISVPVAFSNEVPAMDDDELLTEVKILLLDGTLTDDEEWKVFEVLRSFELNTEVWMNSEICFGSQSSWTVCYNLQDESKFPTLKSKVKEILKSTLPGRKFSIQVRFEKPEENQD